MIKNILSILDPQSKKKLFLFILSSILIGILEMIIFSSIYVYLKFILFVISNIVINCIIKFNSKLSIYFVNSIKSYSFYLLFSPYNLSSFNYKVILKNDIPKENISDNSGLNSPLPNPL